MDVREAAGVICINTVACDRRIQALNEVAEGRTLSGAARAVSSVIEQLCLESEETSGWFVGGLHDLTDFDEPYDPATPHWEVELFTRPSCDKCQRRLIAEVWIKEPTMIRWVDAKRHQCSTAKEAAHEI